MGLAGAVGEFGLADYKDLAEQALAWSADSDGQRRTPLATVGGRGADEVTLAAAQYTRDRLAGGHRQLAGAHLTPGSTVVFLLLATSASALSP